MLTTYIRNAIRSFRNSRLFTAINILGLSIGISAALVIFWIADYEFSFDRFEPNRARIYKVVQQGSFNGNAAHASAVPGPLGAAVQNEGTGIELTIPYFAYQGRGTARVTVPASPTPAIYRKQPNIIYTTPEYFRLVPHEWLAGSPQTSMVNPFTVVLSASRAKLYFPVLAPADVLGKQLSYNKQPLTPSTILNNP